MAPIVVSALIEQFVIETGDIVLKVVLGAAAIFGRHCIGSEEKWCPLFVDSFFVIYNFLQCKYSAVAGCAAKCIQNHQDNVARYGEKSYHISA